MNRIHDFFCDRAMSACNAASGVIPEIGKNTSRGGSAVSNPPFLALKPLAACIGLLLAANVFASPTGGVVVAGNGSITGSANNTIIHQTSQDVAIDWFSFNIGVGQSVVSCSPTAVRLRSTACWARTRRTFWAA
jgi:hypothetical protein